MWGKKRSRLLAKGGGGGLSSPSRASNGKRTIERKGSTVRNGPRSFLPKWGKENSRHDRSWWLRKSQHEAHSCYFRRIDGGTSNINRTRGSGDQSILIDSKEVKGRENRLGETSKTNGPKEGEGDLSSIKQVDTSGEGGGSV